MFIFFIKYKKNELYQQNMMNNNIMLNIPGGNNEWMEIYQMNIGEPIINVNPTKMFNVIFQSDQGKKIIIVNNDTTINMVFVKYLKSISRPDLIGENDIISFLYNGKKINFSEQTKVGSFFLDIPNPLIVVHVVDRMTITKNISFKTTYGINNKLAIVEKWPIGWLLKYYI